MRKTKKIAALTLTIAMAASGMTSVYAVGATGEASVEASKDVKSVGDANTLLTGTIKVTTLSVIIPTTVSSSVDMTKMPGSKTGRGATKMANVQVEQPDDTVYRIINSFASPVWVYVTGVTPEANGGSLPILANTYANVKTEGNNMLFVIKNSAENSPETGTYDGTTEPEPDEIGVPGHWMTTAISSTDKHYLNSTIKGELAAKGLAVNIKAGRDEIPLTVYALVRKGWRVGDRFNVTPVFTVSVTDPTVQKKNQ